MRLSQGHIGGYLIFSIGAMILLGIVGLGFLIGPLIFAAAGLFFINKKHRLIGLACLVLSLIILFESMLHLNIGGLLVAAFFIYIGYRLFTRRDHESRSGRRRMRRSEKMDPNDTGEEDWLDEEIDKISQEKRRKQAFPQDEQSEKFRQDSRKRMEYEYEGDPNVIFKTPRFRSSIIGDLRLMTRGFELDDLNLSNFIGDVKIDLSKAIIPEGESTLVISSFIGDVDIYVPYDLDVSVSTSLTIGGLEVFDYRQGGFNRQVNLETKNYAQASRKVKISISVFVGDIDVRFL